VPNHYGILRRIITTVAISLLALGVVESLAIYPFSLSFFNAFVGGPINGPRHLLHSNVDWGQDHYRMVAWCTNHEEARPFSYLYFGLIDRESLGISFKGVAPTDDAASGPGSLPNGWYAVSVTELRRAHLVANGHNSIEWLHHQLPVDRIGYSILVFHVPKDD